MRIVRMIAGVVQHRLKALRHPKAVLLKEGMPAPDFSLPDETGTIQHLKDYRGSHVVLWFYIRASTPG